MKRKRAILFLLTTVLLITSMATGVFAAGGETFDMVAQITTTVGELTTQFWAMLSVIVPAVCLIVGGKMLITKGLGWFKSLTGKA